MVTVLVQMGMAVAWVCSSSESTRNRRDPPRPGREEGKLALCRSTRPQVASASVPGRHPPLSTRMGISLAQVDK